MYEVQIRTIYAVINRRTYSIVIENLSSELEAQKFCAALNDQEENLKNKLEAKDRELAELRSVLPNT